MKGSCFQAEPLCTERLQLEPLVPADLNDVFEIARNAQSIEDFQYAAASPGDVQAWLEPSLKNPLNLVWTIRERQKTVGLFDLFFEAEYSDTEKDVCRVGYFLDRSVQGRGYATEALSAVAAWVFGTTAVTRIEAGVTLPNRASWRTLENAGFLREKVVLGNWSWRGNVFDSAYYYLTEELFRRAQSTKA